jgi:hypothetical protein
MLDMLLDLLRFAVYLLLNSVPTFLMIVEKADTPSVDLDELASGAVAVDTAILGPFGLTVLHLNVSFW